jgi:hypothetical protein
MGECRTLANNVAGHDVGGYLAAATGIVIGGIITHLGGTMTIHTEWTIREGSTEPVVFVFYDGSTAYDLTGAQEVEIRMVPSAGGSTKSWTDSESELAVTDAAIGEVTFYPAAADLAFSDQAYDVYFKVTDASGYIVYFPSNAAFVIQMLDNP